MLIRIKKILREKNGASLIFVLAVMLLLMALSGSVLVASSTNTTTGVNQKQYYQLNMYSNSVIKSIMYSLQKNKDDNNKNILTDTSSLGTSLLKIIYLNHLDSSSYPLPTKLNISLPDVTINSEITIKFESLSVTVTEFEAYKPSEEGIAEAVNATPLVASVSGNIKITTKITHEDKTVLYQTSYILAGATLEGGISGDKNTPFASDNSENELIIINPGEWRLVSNEMVNQ